MYIRIYIHTYINIYIYIYIGQASNEEGGAKTIEGHTYRSVVSGGASNSDPVRLLGATIESFRVNQLSPDMQREREVIRALSGGKKGIAKNPVCRSIYIYIYAGSNMLCWLYGAL